MSGSCRHGRGRSQCYSAPNGTQRGDSDSYSAPNGTDGLAAPADDHAFRLFIDVVRELQVSGAPPQLSGLKNQLRKRLPDFSEKRHGFNSFLSFAKAARARDLIAMEWDDAAGDYLLRVPD